MGLHRAGFEVFGVDIKPQPRYPFWFRQADALTVDLSGFALIWASPPCQKYSSATRHYDRHKHRGDIIEAVRGRLIESGALYIIENVPRAPIRPDVILQGDMFDLRVVRRRHFETNFPSLAPGALTSGRGRVKSGLAMTVAGGGDRAGIADEWSEAMGIDWPVTRREVCQAIPPAYSECLGRWAMRAIADPPAAGWPSEGPETDRPAVEVLGDLGQARAARDVPPGESWAFREHRPLSEIEASVGQADRRGSGSVEFGPCGGLSRGAAGR